MGGEVVVRDTRDFAAAHGDMSGPAVDRVLEGVGGDPKWRASATGLATPSAVNASIALFTSLTRDPVPVGPIHSVRGPIASKKGATRAACRPVPTRRW